VREVSTYAMRTVVFLILSTVLLTGQTPETQSQESSWQETRAAGQAAFLRGQYREAEPLLSQALMLAQQKPVIEERMVESLRDLSNLYRAMSRNAEAEGLLRAALVVHERQVGEWSPELVRDVDALAWILFAEASFADSAKVFQRSVTILEKANGETSPLLIPALLNYARLEQILQADKETVAALERIVAIREKDRGPESVEVAGDLMRLARHHAAQKRPEAAEPIYIRSLAILEKANGAMHMSLTAPLDELGMLYAGQKRFTEAEPLLRRAVTVREWTNGPLYTETAPALENLGAVLTELKRYPEAEEVYRKALALWELKLGPDHPLMGLTLDRIASLCTLQHKYEEAEAIFRAVLEIREKGIMPTLNNIALVMAAQDNPVAAEPFYQAAITLADKPDPARPKHFAGPKAQPSDPIFALLVTTLENYRDLLAQIGRDSEAAKIDARLKRIAPQEPAKTEVKAERQN
jgi:tetratricopeptide (TPR) repeat protein